MKSKQQKQLEALKRKRASLAVTRQSVMVEFFTICIYYS